MPENVKPVKVAAKPDKEKPVKAAAKPDKQKPVKVVAKPQINNDRVKPKLPIKIVKKKIIRKKPTKQNKSKKKSLIKKLVAKKKKDVVKDPPKKEDVTIKEPEPLDLEVIDVTKAPDFSVFSLVSPNSVDKEIFMI